MRLFDCFEKEKDDKKYLYNKKQEYILDLLHLLDYLYFSNLLMFFVMYIKIVGICYLTFKIVN